MAISIFQKTRSIFLIKLQSILQILTNPNNQEIIKSNDYIRTIYQALTSYKHGIKLIGDTEDICIYTNKNIHNMNMQQMMDMQVSVDKRYNIFVA